MPNDDRLVCHLFTIIVIGEHFRMKFSRVDVWKFFSLFCCYFGCCCALIFKSKKMLLLLLQSQLHFFLVVDSVVVVIVIIIFSLLFFIFKSIRFRCLSLSLLVPFSCRLCSRVITHWTCIVQMSTAHHIHVWCARLESSGIHCVYSPWSAICYTYSIWIDFH